MNHIRIKMQSSVPTHARIYAYRKSNLTIPELQPYVNELERAL